MDTRYKLDTHKKPTSLSLSVSRPSSCGLLGQRATTSTVTRVVFPDNLPNILTLFLKSLESLTKDQPFCIIGLRQKCKYSETFSVGVPQFDMTGLPGTLNNRLCILGKKYNFPKLVVFLLLQVKYLSSFTAFSDMCFFLDRLWNILLHLSTSKESMFLVYLTSLWILLILNCLLASLRLLYPRLPHMIPYTHS